MNQSVLDAPPPLRTRRDGWTPERQAAFLTARRVGLTIADAALSVGMSRRGVYRLCRNPRSAAFVAAWAAIEPAGSLWAVLDDPEYIEGVELQRQSTHSAAAARPGDRWLMRRLATEDRAPKRKPR